MLVYDVAFQYFRIPLLLWNILQQGAGKIALCNSPHGPYFELLFAVLFFLLIALIDTFTFIAFSWIQTLSIQRAFGFSKATPT